MSDRIAELEALNRARVLTEEESIDLEMLIAVRDGHSPSNGAPRIAVRYGWRYRHRDAKYTWMKENPDAKNHL
jgi:hypothetical protein